MLATSHTLRNVCLEKIETPPSSPSVCVGSAVGERPRMRGLKIETERSEELGESIILL